VPSELRALEQTQRIAMPRAYSWTSSAIAILVLFSAAMGIFVPGTYARETQDWAIQARAQDIANVVAIAAFLIAAYYAAKGAVGGRLVWGGCLLFLIYAFFIYTFAAHYNSLFLVYVASLGLLVYTFLGGILRLDYERIKSLSNVGPRTRLTASSYLVISAILFYFLWLSEDIPAAISGTVPASVTQAGLLVNPVHVLDMGLYLPAMIVTGISLWRNGALGYAFALPLLVFSALTGLGIIMIDYLTTVTESVPPSAGLDAFVGALVLISVILSIAYLWREKGREREV
jgi:hypothetical protein